MTLRSPSDIRSDAIQYIDDQGSKIRTETGEPIVDLIDAFSIEGGRLYIVSKYIRSINSIDGWRGIIDDEDFKKDLAGALGISYTSLNIARRLGVPEDLDNDVEALFYHDLNRFADSYGEPRQEAGYATGVERLYVTSNAPFTLSRGAYVQTGDSTPVVFLTSADLTSFTPSFDSEKGMNYVDVAIRARDAGVIGNQPVNTIKIASPPIPNVSYVNNISVTAGGTPRESNSELLDRLEGVLSGNSINVRAGLDKWALNHAGVLDVLVQGPGDSLMTREVAGAVDVWVLGERLQAVSVNTRVVVEEEDFILPYQPVSEVTSAVGPSDTYTAGAGYTFIPDTNEYSESGRASDKITWEASPTGPSASEQVKVNFIYDGLIREMQREVDSQDDVEVPASDVLIRKAPKRLVDFEMTVVALPGVSQTDAENAVTLALQNYLNELKLNKDGAVGLVEYSTAITRATAAEVDEEEAVDRIDGFTMAFQGDAQGTSNLSPGKNEYARLGTVTY